MKYLKMFENLDSYFPKELTRMEYDKYLNRKSEDRKSVV